MLLFSLISQKAVLQGRRDCREGQVLFVDAAAEGDRFRVGVVGDVGFYGSYLCPRWVQTLQQGELYAMYTDAKIAAYKNWLNVIMALDSNVSWWQMNSLQANIQGDAQQRIRRRLLWLRACSRLAVNKFRVRSANNPADPLNRMKSLSQKHMAKSQAEARRKRRGKAADEPMFMEWTSVPSTPWAYKRRTQRTWALGDGGGGWRGPNA